MKKILRTLLMLTCVFCLTACGSEEAISEYQQTKIDAAEANSSLITELVFSLVEQGESDTWLENYNNMELANVFSGRLSAILSNLYSVQYYIEVDGKGVRSAFDSFKTGLEKIGTVVEMGEAASVVDGDTIIVTIPVTGEKANGSIELIFTNDMFLKMKACTLNLNESMSELMVRAAMNTLIGMCTVFTVLVLISFIIAAFGLIPKLQAAFAKKEEVKEVQVAIPAQTEVIEENEELADDMELVAVIAAAIAAYEGTSVEGFRVRSIKRANTNKWKKA